MTLFELRDNILAVFGLQMKPRAPTEQELKARRVRKLVGKYLHRQGECGSYITQEDADRMRTDALKIKLDN